MNYRKFKREADLLIENGTNTYKQVSLTVGAVTFFAALPGVLYNVNGFSPIVAFVLTILLFPVSYGAVSAAMAFTNQEEIKAGDHVLSFIKNYRKIFVGYFLHELFTSVIGGLGCVFLLLSACISYVVPDLLSFDVFDVSTCPNPVALFVFLGIILTVLAIYLGVRLSFVGFAMKDKKAYGWDAIKYSWKLTKNKAWDIFVFYLSYLPWIIVVVLVAAVVVVVISVTNSTGELGSFLTSLICEIGIAFASSFIYASHKNISLALMYRYLACDTENARHAAGKETVYTADEDNEKSDKTEETENTENTEENLKKPEAETSEKESETTDQEKSEKTEKAEKTEEAENTEKVEKDEEVEKDEKDEKTETENMSSEKETEDVKEENTEKAEKTENAEKEEEAEKTSDTSEPKADESENKDQKNDDSDALTAKEGSEKSDNSAEKSESVSLAERLEKLDKLNQTDE